MVKRAWVAAMEVLEVVIDVCEKNNIQYFADGETMLGVLRHEGFIQWDDDIDTCLLRKDYNKLIQALKTDLPYGLVLDGMYSDSERLQVRKFILCVTILKNICHGHKVILMYVTNL